MSCPVVKLAMQLIQCPSISPYDAGCQAIIIQRLKKNGFTVKCIDYGDTKNFWAWHGYGETLAFSGHTDVVPTGDTNLWIYPPFVPIIKNDILFGRGAVDMKGSLAAMVIAAERFLSTYPNHNGRLGFLITSDEEGSAEYGTVKIVEHLIKDGENLDYCLIGEPTSIRQIGDVIKNGRRGSLTCELIIYGLQGHIAYVHSKNNPIHCATAMMHELINVEWDQGNEFFQKTSMQISHIQARSDISNVIPGSLSLRLNFRFNTEITDQIIKERVAALLDKHHLRYTIDWWLYGQPFLTQSGKLINATTSAIIHLNKIKPKLLTTGGTSDGRFIVQMGTQIVELGLINTTIHQINECVSISDLQLLSCIYQRIIEEMFIYS